MDTKTEHTGSSTMEEKTLLRSNRKFRDVLIFALVSWLILMLAILICNDLVDAGRLSRPVSDFVLSFAGSLFLMSNVILLFLQRCSNCHRRILFSQHFLMRRIPPKCRCGQVWEW